MSCSASALVGRPDGRRRVRGQSVVEFVIIFPVFLIILAGAIDLGRLFYAFVAVENAAKEGALFGARAPLCADNTNPRCPDPGNVVWRVEHEATNLASGGVSDLIPTISCVSPDPTPVPRVPLKTCTDGDKYIVAVSYDFHLVTPILGQIFSSGVALRSEARATVLNDAFDPTPGMSVQKLVQYPDADCANLKPAQPIPCFERSPWVDPTNGNLVYAIFHSGESVTYRIIVQNIGGTNLTGVTLVDPTGGWPPVSDQCPARPTALVVGSLPYECTYTRTRTATTPSELQSNTVTGDSLQTGPVEDVATVNIIADPPKLAISKHVNVYLEGGSGAGPKFGFETTWTPFRNTQVPTVKMWFRILVSNDGDLPATSFTLSDSSGSLPSNGDCPAPPSSLAARASYSCRYSRTFDAVGDTTQTATADSSQTGPVTAATTVSVQACGTPTLVIPNLVGMTYDNARTEWEDAGFALTNFTPSSGNNSTTVGTQNRLAYDCMPVSTTITVTP